MFFQHLNYILIVDFILTIIKKRDKLIVIRQTVQCFAKRASVMKRRIVLILSVFIMVMFCSCSFSSVLEPAILQGYKSSDEHFDPDGFQDYVDYCKYYYNEEFDRNFKNNEMYSEIQNEDIENIISYFDDFKGWMKIEQRMDEYDFDNSIITAGDYYHLDTKEGDFGDPDINKFVDYSLYFYDIESHTLYYIHSNI